MYAGLLILAFLLLILIISESKILEGFNSDKLLFHPEVEPHLSRHGVIRDDIGMFFKRGSRRVNFTKSGDLNTKWTSNLARSKSGTNKFLQRRGIPVPKLIVWEESKSHLDNIRNIERYLNYPVVVKPDVGSHGKNVTVGITDSSSVVDAVTKINSSGKIIVEEQLKGKEYRVNVAGGRVVAVSLRQPPTVVGNGRKSLQGLIDEQNERYSLYGETKARKRGVTVDYDFLRKNGIVANSVPIEGDVIILSAVSNYSNGGSFVPVPVKDVNVETRRMLESVSRMTDSVNLGIDFMTTTDISNPYTNAESAGIIEINTNPGVTGTLGCRKDDERASMIDAVIDNLFGNES